MSVALGQSGNTRIDPDRDAELGLSPRGPSKAGGYLYRANLAHDLRQAAQVSRGLGDGKPDPRAADFPQQISAGIGTKQTKTAHSDNVRFRGQCRRTNA